MGGAVKELPHSAKWRIVSERFVGTYTDPADLSEAEQRARAEHATVLLHVHANIFVYACCFWMQQPILPSLTKALGVDSVVFGTLSSVINVFALVGGPLVGRIVDTSGPKTGLIISQGGSFLMYALMACAYTLPILFLSRVPAIAQHAMLCAQAVVSKITLPQNRASALGRLSLSYAIGMVLGSPVGGTISKNYGDHMTCLSASVLSLLMIVTNYVYLPSLTTSTTTDSQADSAAEECKAKPKKSALDVTEIVEVLRVQKVFLLVTFSFLVGLGMNMYTSMFSLIMTDSIHMDSQSLGMLMAYAGVLSVVANVGVVGALSGSLGDFKTMVVASFLLAVGIPSICVYSTDLVSVLVLTTPTSISSTIIYTVLGALISGSVHQDQTGTAISLSHAVRSLCGIISPIVGGYILREFDVPTLGIVAGALIGSACACLWLMGRDMLDSVTAPTSGKKST
ncbi:hypothetical protein SARC_00226 [Sphaeroforma arctica JP610]|uniref:Major facilitator superfamily (MFS) profile domain-containing protein n=1 Tax=Sphaeroforma arctica JP610 TaxID=667725 RepID=A0A0L0GF40_9EUKA|nr:hypothetical protein SARC_00226 [Sphaeroforma arctica JP610]KNC87655.1 hypothetical protein SARC_00226 [Sphaeroforma arctica JP610]|eukprot:XP_014161557.1 hypothetical protein SARC_00226 [Sphaeroforma arctica JP610]